MSAMPRCGVCGEPAPITIVTAIRGVGTYHRCYDHEYVKPNTPGTTRCADCGEEGATTGHMECQYPKDRP